MICFLRVKVGIAREGVRRVCGLWLIEEETVIFGGDEGGSGRGEGYA